MDFAGPLCDRMSTPPLIRALSAAALLASCSSTEPLRPPTESGEIVGRYVDMATTRDRPNIHVRGTDDECGVVFVIDDRTDIVLRNGYKPARRGTFDDLAVGTKVRVWARGVVLLSCPGQAGAERVEVLS